MHQLAALIRKYPFPEALTGYNCQKNAEEKFLAAEHRCKRYNQRFRAIRSTGRDKYARETWYAREYIAYVLGHEPNLQAIMDKCDFTPGSCIGVHGNATNLARKLTSESWTVSDDSVTALAVRAFWNNPQLREYLLNNGDGSPFCVDLPKLRQVIEKRAKVVRYNKIAFVPKTASIFRSMAIESFLNSFCQKGAGSFMELRLKRVGIDLSDQAANQNMARLGSVEQEDPYCTVDLSSASETIGIEAVWELFPPKWVELFDTLRSKAYMWTDGTVKKYHKFVSTGNGFCFPLETLLFASLCHAASKVAGCQTPDFRVYGDDIIVRQSVVQKVLDLLRHFGFTPNSRKTFTSGPFRESCGADWHCGVNVRPIFLDKPLDSLERLFGFHNQSLRRESWVTNYFAQVRDYLLQVIPPEMRFMSDFDPSYVRKDILQPWEQGGMTIDGALWVPQDVYMGSRFSRWNPETQSFSHVALRVAPVVDPAFRECCEDDNYIFMIGALRGGSSSGPFTLRYSAQAKAVIINRRFRSRVQRS
jgi:hypothetical protein